MTKLTKQFVDSIQPSEKELTYWDDEIKGFGLRVRGKKKSWVLMYRNQYGIKKRLTLGNTAEITPNEARNKAKFIKADIRLNKADPALERSDDRQVKSVTELCDLYLKSFKRWQLPNH